MYFPQKTARHSPKITPAFSIFMMLSSRHKRRLPCPTPHAGENKMGETHLEMREKCNFVALSVKYSPDYTNV